MLRRCVVCGQLLPAGISQSVVSRRLEKLNSAAAAREAKTIRSEFAGAIPCPYGE
jgi:hypothetical protein